MNTSAPFQFLFFLYFNISTLIQKASVSAEGDIWPMADSHSPTARNNNYFCQWLILQLRIGIFVSYWLKLYHLPYFYTSHQQISITSENMWLIRHLMKKLVQSSEHLNSKRICENIQTCRSRWESIHDDAIMSVK